MFAIYFYMEKDLKTPKISVQDDVDQQMVYYFKSVVQ